MTPRTRKKPYSKTSEFSVLRVIFLGGVVFGLRTSSFVGAIMQLMAAERAVNSNPKNISSEMNAGDIARMAGPVFERHNIERAILFGSFATGRQSRKSDVDLILIKSTTKRYFERFDGLLEDLYRAIPGREIECFVYTPQELASMSHRLFIQRALGEGTVIYERG